MPQSEDVTRDQDTTGHVVGITWTDHQGRRVHLSTQPSPQQMAATFAKRLRERREAMGLSQSMVALIMATSGFESWRQTTMAKVESGDRDVKLAEAIALTQIVADRVPLDDMVGRFDGKH